MITCVQHHTGRPVWTLRDNPGAPCQTLLKRANGQTLCEARPVVWSCGQRPARLERGGGRYHRPSVLWDLPPCHSEKRMCAEDEYGLRKCIP